MSVTIDHEPLAAEKLGMKTVGQVLAHVQKENRLVTSLLIDGQEPDLNRIGTVRQALLSGHTLFIRTTEPTQMALEVLGDVEDQLDETDRLRVDAIDFLQRGQANRALEKLSGCFTAWQNAQESVIKISQLLKINLETLRVKGRPLARLVDDFTVQLRQIKTTLENRDFVTLGDILAYEATETSSLWRDALAALRDAIDPV